MVKPVKISFTFDSENDAREFIGGFLDGWGENGPFSAKWADMLRVPRACLHLRPRRRPVRRLPGRGR